jgi:hypothetical protein
MLASLLFPKVLLLLAMLELSVCMLFLASLLLLMYILQYLLLLTSLLLLVYLLLLVSLFAKEPVFWGCWRPCFSLLLVVAGLLTVNVTPTADGVHAGADAKKSKLSYLLCLRCKNIIVYMRSTRLVNRGLAHLKDYYIS